MTRYERVKAAIAHRTPDKLPSCIHLAGDGREKYYDMLFDKYVKGDILQKYNDGKIGETHAINYAIGNHVLAVGCPWWDWYDLPAEYVEYDAPEFLPKTVGTGQL